ncbi:hypothetical protein M408DRAFT_28129 [Serendipita vermifera MAFF 305830]|uniref:Uncharacterized protein n=1 Tax=Serendipita vermifera MAFF 305830 TaxID=933852 RepID=A0A0C3ASZ2_SERVB|nr:hypothetical protein M408DRAFT_28129 [Serendipita vermifera MAFF 305830]
MGFGTAAPSQNGDLKPRQRRSWRRGGLFKAPDCRVTLTSPPEPDYLPGRRLESSTLRQRRPPAPATEPEAQTLCGEYAATFGEIRPEQIKRRRRYLIISWFVPVRILVYVTFRLRSSRLGVALISTFS